MSGRNYGPAVSGYLDPTGRNWEVVVFQAGKPVLDKELSLAQGIDGGQAESALLRSMPSGWLADDYLISSNPVSAIFTASAISNTLQVPNGLKAHVNGWIINVLQTNATGTNQLSLGAGPAGAGVRRTDIVVLEVWRMLLSAAPSTTGKSATARIWQNGNVKTDPANDAVLNYADDIQDTNVGSETTKRVQIQYRLRVMQGIDLFAYPYGLEDPSAVANSIPTSPATPDGVATLFTYANQSASGDPGLWIAGDGNPANTLGTVDGYMYAIPLLAVFRRNTTAFDRILNQNGGVASPGPSDRPDGLFSDIIVARDLADLRLGVSPNGWNLAEILEKNANYLFDNNLFTEWTDTSPFGGGSQGTTVFAADEIGPFPSDGAGPLIGDFDAVRRRYSGRAIYETVTVAIPAPGGAWSPGASVTIDPTALPIYPYTAFNWSSFAPSSVVISDITDAWWIGAAATKKTVNATPYILTVTSLGALPVVTVTVTVGGAGFAGLGLTNEVLYVDLLIAYPTGQGLTRTPTASYGANSFALTGGTVPAGAPYSFSAFASQSIDATHREVQLEYTTVTLTITQAADTVTAADPLFRLPERAQSIVAVSRQVGGIGPFNPIAGGTVIDTTGRIVNFTNVLDFTNPGDVLQIQYTAVRPMPQNAEQMTVYYEYRAPQTARSALLGTSIQVIPKLVSGSLYSITVGSGSQDEGYPFPQAYVQTGGIYPTSTGTYNGESELSARADIAVTEFNAATGFLRLPLFVPMVAAPEGLTFNRSVVDTDIEGRSFFKTVPGGAYVPNAYAQDLSDPKRHKDILPIVCELAADSLLGHRGQLVLVLMLRYALFDETDGVFFNSDLTQNTTTAAVFRVKGNLLNKRSV